MNLVHRGNLDRSLDEDDVADDVAASRETQRVLGKVADAIQDTDAVRDSLADLYRSLRPGTVAEVEVGDALQAVRTAMKRLRKAQENLLNPPLPGM